MYILFKIQYLTSQCRCQFSDAIAFSELGLSPQRTISFVNEFAFEVLVTGRPATSVLPSALHASMTNFTRIVHIRPTEKGPVAEQFERLHHKYCPNEQKLPMQCPKCNAY